MPVAADIYYHSYQEEEGEKLPVILLHGAGGNHLYWPPQVRRLAGCRVYSLDLAGHGKSGMCGQQSIASYAKSVVDWMGAVGLGKALFVGHSMGSAIAMLLALDYSQHVLGLALFGSAARLQVNSLLLEKSANPANFYQAVELVTSWSYAPGTPASLSELAARRMAETRPAVLYGDLLACDAFDVTDRLAEIRQPTLVVCGAEDVMTPVRSAQFLAAAIPGARLEIIPDAGHMVMIEQPDAAAAVLARFVSELPYSSVRE
jgi:pimeloyl-ACP methyl ester carboxylesterase